MKNAIISQLSILIALSCGFAAHADNIVIGNNQSRGTILKYSAYSDYAGGDIVFQTEIPLAGCEDGFWLRPSDPGFKAGYASMLAAYLSKSPVRVFAYDGPLWPGSPSGRVCRVYLIGPM